MPTLGVSSSGSSSQPSDLCRSDNKLFDTRTRIENLKQSSPYLARIITKITLRNDVNTPKTPICSQATDVLVEVAHGKYMVLTAAHVFRRPHADEVRHKSNGIVIVARTLRTECRCHLSGIMIDIVNPV